MAGDEVEALRAENARLRQRLAELEAGENSPSMEFLRAAVASAPAYIVGAGPDDRIRYINRLRTDLPLGEVIGTEIYAHVEPGGEAQMREAIRTARRTGRTARYEVTGRGEEPAEYDCYVSPLPGPDGTGVCIVAVDVTEQRMHQRALRESEEKLRVALSATRVGLWSWDLRTNDVLWDHGMRELTGRREAVTPDRYLEALVHPDDRELVRRELERAFEHGAFEAAPHRIVRPDGEVRWVLSTGRVMREDGEPSRIVGGHIDVTEQRQTEEQLRQAQKLDAVGRLTAGVAHNFNNMLAAILPTLELLRPRVDERDRRMLDDALHAGTRAAEMVRQLMTFAGQRRDGSWISVRPAALVEAALGICRRTFDRHIELHTAIAPGLPPLLCESGAVEQVLVNLLLNARDAVHEAGSAAPRIAVSAELVDAAAAPAPPRELARTSAYLRLRVEDDGVGMSPQVQRRVFEPFFTTKDVGSGTGLGLATSYAIVREHGGWIDCESAPGRGTVFSVYLPAPAVETPVDRAPAEPVGEAFAARVLLVDDEDAVRRVVGRLLEQLGHRVRSAPDGASALRALEADPAVDVVLLDRSMPGAPGDHFVDDIRALCPTAKILLFTGHEVGEGVLGRTDGLVPKPVKRGELDRALREALGRGPSFAGRSRPG